MALGTFRYIDLLSGCAVVRGRIFRHGRNGAASCADSEQRNKYDLDVLAQKLNPAINRTLIRS